VPFYGQLARWLNLSKPVRYICIRSNPLLMYAFFFIWNTKISKSNRVHTLEELEPLHEQ